MKVVKLIKASTLKNNLAQVLVIVVVAKAQFSITAVLSLKIIKDGKYQTMDFFQELKI